MERPAGFPPYAAPGRHAIVRPYQSTRKRAAAVELFLAINAIAAVILIVADILAGLLIVQPDPPYTLVAALRLSATVWKYIFFGSLGGVVVSFSLWLFRTLRNMPVLGATDRNWGPLASLLFCVIPILSLANPYLSVVDAWRGAAPEKRVLDIGARRSIGIPRFVWMWWAAWLGSRVLVGFAASLSRSTDVNVYLFALGIDALGEIWLIASAVLLIKTVRDVTVRQDLKHDLITTGRLA